MIANHELTVSKTFFTLALFNMLQQPLNQMPNTMLNAIQAIISFGRMAEFLYAEEIDQETIEHVDNINNYGNLYEINK